jgi:hypothetical protein
VGTLLLGIFIGLGLGLAFHWKRTREIRAARDAALEQNDTTNRTNAELRVENKRLQRAITKELNAISQLKGRLCVLLNQASRVEPLPNTEPSSVGKPTAPLALPTMVSITEALTRPLGHRVTAQLAI